MNKWYTYLCWWQRQLKHLIEAFDSDVAVRCLSLAVLSHWALHVGRFDTMSQVVQSVCKQIQKNLL